MAFRKFNIARVNLLYASIGQHGHTELYNLKEGFGKEGKPQKNLRKGATCSGICFKRMTLAPCKA